MREWFKETPHARENGHMRKAKSSVFESRFNVCSFLAGL